jgi:hypothetical protein
MNNWLPTKDQKAQAVRELPYLKNENFVEVRSDRRNQTQYSFIRKPSYYAIFNTGKIITDQQRYGLGLVWSPLLGTILQSQSRSDMAAWGTRITGKDRVFEASDIDATFLVGTQPWNPAPGSNSVQDSFSLSYPLGADGNKTIHFSDDAIEVDVHHKGELTEIVPLLIGQDCELSIDNRQIILLSKSGKMIITIETEANVSLHPHVVDTRGGKPCRVIEIKSKNNLRYLIRMAVSEDR